MFRILEPSPFYIWAAITNQQPRNGRCHHARQACLFQLLTLYSSHLPPIYWRNQGSVHKSQAPIITVAQPPCEFTASSHVEVTAVALCPVGFYFVFLISGRLPPIFFHHGPTTIGTKETKTSRWSRHNQQRLKHAHKSRKATVKTLRNWHQTGGRQPLREMRNN